MKKSKISKNVSEYYYALENDNIIIDVTMNYARNEIQINLGISYVLMDAEPTLEFIMIVSFKHNISFINVHKTIETQSLKDQRIKAYHSLDFSYLS